MSDLETAFDTLWRLTSYPPLDTEIRFHPPRRWRLDRGHVAAMVGVELDGATWTGGRHTRGAGYSKDCTKLNQATADGWAVFRITRDMLDNDPMLPLSLIAATISARLSRSGA